MPDQTPEVVTSRRKAQLPPPLRREEIALDEDLNPKWFNLKLAQRRLQKIAELGGDPKASYQFSVGLKQKHGDLNFEYPTFEEVMATPESK